MAFFMQENTNLPTENSIVNSIKQHIITHYEPCTFSEASIRLSNEELFELIMRAFPNDEFNREALYSFMKDQGFEYVELTAFKFNWVMRKKIL